MDRAYERSVQDDLVSDKPGNGDSSYRNYCQQVCSVLKKATRKEKASLTQELTAHMEDHVEALVELGWDPQEAMDYAVEAMGDPEIVGRQYDEKLSSFWLWCGYVLRAMLFFYLVYLLCGPIQEKIQNLRDNQQARTDPQWGIHGEIMGIEPWISQPLDMVIPVGEQWFRVYRVEVYEISEGDSYTVGVFTVNYANDPLHKTAVNTPSLDGSGAYAMHMSTGAWYFGLLAPVEKGQSSIGMKIAMPGEDIELQIPIPWEVIPCISL